MPPRFWTRVKHALEAKYHPAFVVSKLATTNHTNVFKIASTDGKDVFVAKCIDHVVGDPDLGPTQMDAHFKTEKHILELLPRWWGLALVDSYIIKDPHVRVILTPLIANDGWMNVAVGDAKTIAKQLKRQLSWLGANGIQHGDMEMKNIMWDGQKKRAIIIDFEKSKIHKMKTLVGSDMQQLLRSLQYHYSKKPTRGIKALIDVLS